MSRRSVVFEAPGEIGIRTDTAPSPGADEVLVRTHVSGISAGTERLFYRGDVPEGIVLDTNLPSLSESFRFPTTYGYACVGESDIGERVFSFQPHTSHFVALKDEIYQVPDDISSELAALWPSAETAVNLVLDAEPRVGERVLVVGQGVIGLATTSLLARYPLEKLWSVDPLAARRDASLAYGATRALTPLQARDVSDFDLAIELSGTSDGLNRAIAAVGFEGRVIVGSWYGANEIPVAFGTHFHRSRVQLKSSQVSNIGASLSSRWTKARRMRAAADVLRGLSPHEIVTHRFPVEDAAEAYELVGRPDESCLQVVLTYT